MKKSGKGAGTALALAGAAALCGAAALSQDAAALKQAALPFERCVSEIWHGEAGYITHETCAPNQLLSHPRKQALYSGYEKVETR